MLCNSLKIYEPHDYLKTIVIDVNILKYYNF